jgi:hypothetical protein
MAEGNFVFDLRWIGMFRSKLISTGANYPLQVPEDSILKWSLAVLKKFLVKNYIFVVDVINKKYYLFLYCKY